MSTAPAAPPAAPSPSRRAPLAAEAAALAATFALLAVYVSHVIWDIDVFWHIAAGRAFTQLGEVPTTDIFTAIDPDRTWVSFQWLYQLGVYHLERLGGLQLVRFVHAAVMWLAFLGFYHACRRRLALGALPSLVLLALLLVLFEDRIRVRPHVFNLAAMVILLPWLVRGPAALGRAACLTTAAVVAVWANLHAGGAFLFLAAASALPVGAALHVAFGAPDARPQLRRALLWYACALVPALLSPHFVRGTWQAFTQLEGSEAAIGEWWPAWYFLVNPSAPAHYLAGAFPTLVLVLWLLVAAPVLAALTRGKAAVADALTRYPAWALGVSLAFIVLAHRSVRFIYEAELAFLILLPLLAHRIGHLQPPARVRPYVLAVYFLGLHALAYHFNVVALQGDLPTAVQRAFGDEPLDTRRFPTAQADFLARTGFRGNVYAQGNWGSYLLYRLWPDVRVTADGRGNYAAQVAEDLALTYDRRVMADPDSGPRVAQAYQRYPVDAIVHQHPVWPAGYQPDPRQFLRVFSDGKGAIWVRNTPAGQAYLDHLQTLMRAGRPPARAPH